MAKKRSAAGANKSQAIRDYLSAQPEATPNEIVAGLKQQGITVSPGLASNVKYTSGRASRKVRGRRGRRVGRPAGRTRGSNGALSASDLIEAKKLADQLGGIEQARRALEALEELR